VPGACVATKNCRFAVKIRTENHKFVISMMTHRSMYVAVGFTEDQRRVRAIQNETLIHNHGYPKFWLGLIFMSLKPVG
jgi:hypothetical protein